MKITLFLGKFVLFLESIFVYFMNMKKQRKPSALNATNIKTADLSLLDFLKQVDMLPGKIGVFDSLEGLDLSGYFCLKGIILLIIEHGNCTVEVNTKTYELKKGSVFVAFPEQIIRVVQISDDIKPLCVACSIDMLNELLGQVRDSIQLLLLVKKSPYQQLGKTAFLQIVDSFKQLQRKMSTLRDNPFYSRIINNHLIAIAFECVGLLYKKSGAHQFSNRKESLLNAFIRNVEEHHRTEHSVKFYADMLFVTPKYLSTVVGEISGKGAKQWIDEYIALDAKVLLQSTQMDIQEISDELNFPDVSFFGKFFKRMTGVSPKAFRLGKLASL